MKPTDQTNLYLDFNQFNDMRRTAREDKDTGLRQTAQQMEGMFLNMMLQSMRQANAAFSEGNLFESDESQYFRDMLDKQLTSNLSSGQGIGLAEIIYQQLSNKDQAQPQPAEGGLPLERARLFSRPGVGNGLTQGIGGDPFPLRVLEPANWDSPTSFIAALKPHAEQAAAQLQVEPEALLAQAALETGWGQHVMENRHGRSSYNFFGIKADAGWQGESTQKQTLEYRNGFAAEEVAAFRSYAGVAEAFQDFVNFLRENPRYQSLMTEKTEAKQWGYELQKAGYATDPNYGNKIASILESDVLQTAVTLSGNR